MEEINEIQKNKNRIISEEYYYYLSPSQSMNIIDTVSLSQNFKNLEPQDNLKKSHQRQLLKNEKIIKNKINEEEEKIDKINNDSYDIKSLTAVKRNKTNRIFQINSMEIKSNEDIYKMNLFNKNYNDNNIILNNKNDLDDNFVYEKKNINKFEKENSENIVQNDEENIEKIPMDNIKKKKTDKNEINKGQINSNINFEEEKNQNQNQINENDKIKINENADIHELKENKNKIENEEIISEDDNIVFKDIKVLKNENENNNKEAQQLYNNKLEFIKDLNKEEENGQVKNDIKENNEHININNEEKENIINIKK